MFPLFSAHLQKEMNLYAVVMSVELDCSLLLLEALMTPLIPVIVGMSEVEVLQLL